MKKFALAVLFSLAGLAGFGELAGLPGVTKHKYIEPGTYVSTDTWMTVSGRVEGVANKAAKKYASTSCARILPPYLHEVSFDDVYPDDAAWFYQQVGHAYTGHCSARRNGNVLERNFDWKFDEAPTFVVRVSAAAGRFASLGVATIGELVTEGQVNSHQWFPYFRCLPGHTVDGVNERGVVCEVNVTDGTWPRTEGEIHGLGAVRWALDNGTNAQQVAEYLADHVYLPEGFGGNLHWIVADATSTYIVEDGEAILMEKQPVVMTNFSQDRTGGEGYERWASLTNLATTIESQWWTKAYDRDTRPIRLTDLGPDYEQIWTYWAQYPKEMHRNQKIGGIGWWQTVHTSIYDLTNRVLRVSVQETDDWYTFQVPSSGANVDAYTKAETDAKLAGKLNGPNDSGIVEAGLELDALTLVGRNDVSTYGDVVVRDSDETPIHYLSLKADRANSSGTVLTDEIATLDEDGNPTRSGIAKTDVRITKDLVVYEIPQDVLPFSDTNPGSMIAFDGVTVVRRGQSCYLNSVHGGDFAAFDEEGIFIGSPDTIRFNGKPGVSGVWPKLHMLVKSSMISATNPTFSNAVMGVASHTNAAFAAEVLAVQVASLSTNITAEVYIAATNACANLGIDPALIPGAGTTGTVGGFIVMLFAVVFWMRKKIFDNSGKVNDAFAGELLGKQVAISAMHYALGTAITASAKLADRTTNFVNALSTLTDPIDLTFPDLVTGKCRDFLVRVHRATGGVAVSFTAPTSAVIYGDGFSTAIGENEDWLFAITETAANEWYVRAIKLEVAA